MENMPDIGDILKNKENKLLFLMDLTCQWLGAENKSGNFKNTVLHTHSCYT